MRSQDLLFALFGTLFLSLLSLPATAQWARLESNTANNLHDVHFLNEDYGLAVGDTSTILLTTDGGESWLPLARDFKENFQSALVLNADSLLIAGGNYFDGSVYRTANGGFDWEYVTEGIDLTQTPNLIYALDNETIFKSSNRGGNWKSSVIIIGSTILLENMLAPSDSVAYALGNVSGFATYSAFGFRTDNAGDTWTALFETDFPNANAYTAAFFPHPDTGYVFNNEFISFQPGVVNQLVRVTDFYFDDSNFLKSWRFQSEIVNDSLPAFINAAFFLDTQTGFAAGADGNIYKTTNGGVDWTMDYQGEEPINALYILPGGPAFAVGDGGLILKLADTATSTHRTQTLPLRLFPNPAAQSLTIDLRPEQAGLLRLFNTTGQLVRQTPVSGRQTVNLPRLPAGLYLAEIRLEEGIYRSKVLIQQ